MSEEKLQRIMSLDELRKLCSKSEIEVRIKLYSSSAGKLDTKKKIKFLKTKKKCWVVTSESEDRTIVEHLTDLGLEEYTCITQVMKQGGLFYG